MGGGGGDGGGDGARCHCVVLLGPQDKGLGGALNGSTRATITHSRVQKKKERGIPTCL